LQEVQALYARYNPEKLPEVGTLLGKYGEAKLLAMVRLRQASSGSSLRDQWRCVRL
jgi:hypothetical protein